MKITTLQFTDDMLETFNKYYDDFIVYLHYLQTGLIHHTSQIDDIKQSMIIIVSVNPNVKFPRYGDVGLDLYADEDAEIPHSSNVVLVKLGIKSYIPVGWEAQIRPRSSLYKKYKVILTNSPGTIDPTYRNEWMASLTSLTGSKITKNTKIVQAVFTKYLVVDQNSRSKNITNMLLIKTDRQSNLWNNWHKLLPTDRGQGGFGSTGN